MASNRTYLVWCEQEKGFVQSIGHAGIFYSDGLDDAFQFTSKVAAEEASEVVPDGQILEWL